MKKIIYIFIFITCFFLYPINSFASTNTFERTEEDLRVPSDIEITEVNKELILKTPSVDEKEKVYDFADLFTEQEEKEIYEKIIDFINETNLDMVVVTISKNNKISTREYAADFYDYNFFKLNGYLFIIDMDNREFFLLTTGIAENYIMYDRLDMILDYAVPNIKNEKYALATINIVKHLNQLFSLGIADVDENLTIFMGNVGKNYHILEITIFSLIATFVTMIVLISKNKMVKHATSSRNYLDQKTVQIKNVSNLFLGKNVTKKVKIKSSDSGFGGSSSRGGSRSFRSSSGRSHGGGGRKF